MKFRPTFARRFERLTELYAISRQRALSEQEIVELQALHTDMRGRGKRLPAQIGAAEAKARALRAELAALADHQHVIPTGDSNG